MNTPAVEAWLKEYERLGMLPDYRQPWGIRSEPIEAAKDAEENVPLRDRAYEQ